MGLFGRCKGGGRRSAARAAVPLTGVFTTLTRSNSAVVVDISSDGVRLRGADLPRMGEELLVTVVEIQAFGTVVWSDQGECGIAFDQPLSRENERFLKDKLLLARDVPPDMKAVFDDWVLDSGR